ncbi:MAG: TIGR03936 family radical SAM-associated protein [Spirochaetaceae bacterium]|jgi:radical SAM superfamily enzyme YgiQ (UPF0313 family)|nr:TIGR03936 family radical SAM-associated protein [Spirochaetaceae bacterium]
MSIRFVNPEGELGAALLSVEKPARYTGGEYGRLAERGAMAAPALRMAVCFPDLYEIAMSNQALKILYNRLNALPHIVCDRAFAPAPDFEALLRERGLPLYGLDTGISLGDTDLLCFTLGYELGITGILAMLEDSAVPLRSRDRGESDPVVLLGGPCAANPRPFELFIDAFWIGEAEGGFFDLAEELSALKQAGKGRGALLSRLREHPSVYYAGRKEPARRAVDRDFALGGKAAVFPVPGLKIVQQHGAVEIMRGCPNGCRFCQAGIWYRPMRQKDRETVLAETDSFVREGGYREISLSSLSTGDYGGLNDLLESLDRNYGPAYVSFQLPSLRVSSFSLNLLEKLSRVRKGGLTFAVETPGEWEQLALNKRVAREQVTAIIREARRRGWRGVKFYFMIGLPGAGSAFREEQEIAAFVNAVAGETGLRFSINVGIFIPKAHTPFQWAPQIDPAEAQGKLDYIRSALRGHKVSTAGSLTSLVEGFISRGDGRAGEVILEAFRRGCRLDAWDEYFRGDVWEELLTRHGSLAREFLSGSDPASPLPWDGIDSGAGGAFLREEWRRSQEGLLTGPCAEDCGHPCGICTEERGRVTVNRAPAETPPGAPPRAAPELILHRRDPATHRILFSYAKTAAARWLPHLSIIEVFSMAALRARIPVLFTGGFNPLPRIDFAAPLSLGLRSLGEIAVIDVETAELSGEDFAGAINPRLSEGLRVLEAEAFTIPPGLKKYAPAALLWGFLYEAAPGAGTDRVPAPEEKAYRNSRLEAGESLLDLTRVTALARDPRQPSEAAPRPYAELYRELYP